MRFAVAWASYAMKNFSARKQLTREVVNRIRNDGEFREEKMELLEKARASSPS